MMKCSTQVHREEDEERGVEGGREGGKATTVGRGASQVPTAIPKRVCSLQHKLISYNLMTRVGWVGRPLPLRHWKYRHFFSIINKNKPNVAFTWRHSLCFFTLSFSHLYPDYKIFFFLLLSLRPPTFFCSSSISEISADSR